MYILAGRRGSVKLKFMAARIHKLKENAQSVPPDWTQKVLEVHSGFSQLNGTYLMRGKQTPIKLFHKALS